MAGNLLVTTLRLDGTGRYLADMAKLEGAHAKYERSTERSSGVAAGGLRAFENAALGVAAVTAGLGAVSLNAAVDFETAFTGVTKTVDGTAQQLDRLRTGILDLSETPRGTAEELSAIAESAGQLGIATDNVLGFTETMADLGQTTNLSAEQAATTLARFANITGTSQNDFDRLGSTIVELGNNFATTESEITEMAIRVAGAGTAVGLSADEILSLSAALSSVGIEAEAGGTAITQVLFGINTAVEQGGEDLAGFAELAGQSADDFARAWDNDAATALDAVIRGIGRMSEDGGNLSTTLDDLELSGVRVQSALIAAGNAGELTADAFERGGRAFEENSALAEEASKRYETTESRLASLKGEVQRALIDTGTERLPDLLKLLEDNTKNLPELLGNLADAGINLIEAFAAGLPVVDTLARLLAAIPPDVLAMVSAFGLASRSLKLFGEAQIAITGGSTVSAAAGGPLGIALTAMAAIKFNQVTRGLAAVKAEAAETESAVTDLGTQLRAVLAGTEEKFSFAGILEDLPAINPDTIGSIVEGDYALSIEALDRAGVSQQEFAEAALGTGEALDQIGDRLDATSDQWGKFEGNARDAAHETAEAIRGEAIAALEDLVAQGAITESALRRIRDSTRDVTTETRTRTENVLVDNGAGGSRLEAVQIEYEIDVKGEENLTEAYEKTLQFLDASEFAADAAETLGLSAEAAAEVANISVGVDGIVDVERLTDLLYDLRFAGDVDLSGIPDDLAAAALAAGQFSTTTGDSVKATEDLVGLFRENADVSFLEAETIAAGSLGLSVEELRQKVPELHGALFNAFGAGTKGVIDATAIGVGNIGDRLDEAGEGFENFAAGIDLADQATTQAEASFAGLGYTASTVAVALENLTADADIGEILLSNIAHTERSSLAFGLLTGNMEVVAETADNLGLSEQALADINAGLAQSIENTADSYAASIPTFTGALTDLKSGLEQDAKPSLSGFLDTVEAQQRAAFDFSANIAQLKDEQSDDLAAALVELAESDPVAAAQFAESAAGSSKEIRDEYERRIEIARAGERTIEQIRSGQATGLTLTSNEVLNQLETDGGETAQVLADQFGVSVDTINAALSTIGTDGIGSIGVDTADFDNVRAQAALDLAGFSAIEAVAQLVADPTRFDETLAVALLQIDGFTEEEIEAIIAADDDEFQLVLAGVLHDLGLMTDDDYEATIRALKDNPSFNATQAEIDELTRDRTVRVNLEAAADKFLTDLANTSTQGKIDFAVLAAGLSQGGLVDFYASGGLREPAHIAHIMPAGTWRISGEPETGGEAYIPMGLPKRARSTAILDEVAGRFGYQLVSAAERRMLESRQQAAWFADGGIHGAPPVRPAVGFTSGPIVNNTTTSVDNRPLQGAHVTVQAANPEAFAEWARRQKRRNALTGVG